MGYLMGMSLSGTAMTGICTLIRECRKHKVSARSAYLLAKAAILYYLIPLPELGERYSRMLMSITCAVSRHVFDFSPRWSYYMIRANGDVYINSYMKIQYMAAAIWILGAAFVFLAELLAHYRSGKRLVNCMDEAKVSAETWGIRRGGRFCHIQQKVTVYRDVPDGQDVTFGLFRPVILCTLKEGKKQEEYALQHEMVHVRRGDIFWKMLLRLATILHWWNPAVWYLYHAFERLCECSCDEVVLWGKTTEEKKDYLRLVVIEAEKVKKNKRKPENPRWGLGFELGKEARRIEERMENAMRMKKWNSVAAMLLVIVLTMINSVTVLAYPKVHTMTQREAVSEEIIKMELNGGSIQFVPDDASEEELKKDRGYILRQIQVRYEEQFTDIDGNIFPVNDITNENKYSSCSHTYVSGIRSMHTKLTSCSACRLDEGCTLTAFYAERCSKCRDVIMGNRLFVANFDLCSH